MFTALRHSCANCFPRVIYTVLDAGNYISTTTLKGVVLPGSPAIFSLQPAAYDAVSTKVLLPATALTDGTAGSWERFSLQAYDDAFGNVNRTVHRMDTFDFFIAGSTGAVEFTGSCYKTWDGVSRFS